MDKIGPPFTVQFQREIIARVEAGESPGAISKSLGGSPSTTTIRNWVKEHSTDQGLDDAAMLTEESVTVKEQAEFVESDDRPDRASFGIEFLLNSDRTIREASIRDLQTRFPTVASKSEQSVKNRMQWSDWNELAKFIAARTGIALGSLGSPSGTLKVTERTAKPIGTSPKQPVAQPPQNSVAPASPLRIRDLAPLDTRTDPATAIWMLSGDDPIDIGFVIEMATPEETQCQIEIWADGINTSSQALGASSGTINSAVTTGLIEAPALPVGIYRLRAVAVAGPSFSVAAGEQLLQVV